MDHCFILIEHANKKIRPVSFELLAAARELQKLLPLNIAAIILGQDCEILAESFARQTGVETINVKVPGLGDYQSEIYKTVLLELLSEHPFKFLLAGHSTQGLDIIPALAVHFKAGCLTGIEGFGLDGDKLSFRRSICSGKLVTDMVCHTGITMLTIQPGSFKPAPLTEDNRPQITKRTCQVTPNHIEYVEIRPSASDNSALKEAKIIVAAGRGIEAEENIELVRQLSRLFARSAVAGSRPLCDLGWLEYHQQVGVTGATVSPELYIACGISGTSQHITGMKGSGYIVAINKDPHSAMFNISDLCIVEDVTTFIPLLLEEFQKSKSES